MRILIAGIILSALAFFGGFQLHQALYPRSENITVSVDSEPSADQTGSQGHLPAPGAIHFSNYKAIGEKSLFRPERREWNPPLRAEQPTNKKPEPAKPKPPPPKLVLYGTVIFGEDVKMAIIKGDGGKGGPGGERESYRLGDEISGYRLQSIEEDSVLLVKGDDAIELKLREGKKLPVTLPARQERIRKARRPASAAGGKRPAASAVKKEPERIVVRGPGGREIVKRKKVIRTPFGPRTIYIEER